MQKTVWDRFTYFTFYRIISLDLDNPRFIDNIHDDEVVFSGHLD
jgi:hypothetical protein